MKAKNLLLTLTVGAIALSSCNSGSMTSTTATLKSENDTASYYIGYMYGTGIQRSGMKEPNMQAILAGMNAAIQKTDIKADQMQMQMYLSNYLQKLAMKIADENLKKGQAFMQENAKKSGIDTMGHGIQYKVVKAGNGPKPAATDVVKVNYKGTLIDGTEFDSSKEPVEFGLNQVIPGWTEAIQQMPVGSTWIIYIPSEMAYGQRGAGGAIGPNETLIFEVELLDIVQPETATPEADK